MKKILSLLLLVGTFFCLTTNVSAAPLIDDTFVPVTFEIAWHDYDNKLGYRPDEITLQFMDNVNLKEEYNYTFKKDEVDVRRVDDETTIWSIERIVYMDHEDGAQIYYTENARFPHYSYPLGTKDYITRENRTLTVDFYILPFKTITYTEHWDDGNARDFYRDTDIALDGDDGKYIRVSCADEEDTYIDANTCQKEVYIEDAYHKDEFGNPLLDKPVQFVYKSLYANPDYDYKIVVDEEGNIDVYITHEPYRIDDSKVTINWDDENDKAKKRPDKLEFGLYNFDTQEQTITVTKEDDWEEVITNLYKNKKEKTPSQYSLRLKNTEDYEFTITGDNKEGFVVDAKYIGDLVDTPQEQQKVEVNNPNTSDSIIIMTTLFIISLTGLGLTAYKFKKCNHE